MAARDAIERAGRAAAFGALLFAVFAASSPSAADAGGVGVDDPRVVGRSAGSDVATARRIAAALLARPLAAQLTRVRCERVGPHVDCGLTVSGTKFHRPLDIAGWDTEIAGLVDGAFAAAPEADEIDCWATVPLGAAKGTVVSGDYAKPTAATVFSVTVPRARRGQVRARLASGAGVFWDPAFRASLSKGTRG
ncbi:MAG TPA: hypothetical protein VK665_11115 [Candidatus Elarobacter sp.]|nr:hypothetical protein [Candidatus Elarobacter sp.]